MKISDLALADRASGQTRTRWLYEELRAAILDGRLKRGALVPPTRQLAETYAVSRRIVVNAFDQLRDEGYLIGRVGAGTLVSDRIPDDFLPRAPVLKQSHKPPTVSDSDYRRPV